MSTIVPEKAVLCDESMIGSLMELRRQRGLDERDEVWEGVLHMVPPPSEGHSGALTEISIVLGPVAKSRGGRLRIGLGVRELGTGERNYRVPDLVYIAPEDLPKLGPVYCEGGPAVVLEVPSPRDESYEKLGFFASIGTREVVVIDPISKRAEVFRLAGDRLVAVAADREGRVPVEGVGVRFQRRGEGEEAALFLLDDAAPESSLGTRIA